MATKALCLEVLLSITAEESALQLLFSYLDLCPFDPPPSARPHTRCGTTC